MNRGFDIPWIGYQNTMGMGFDIPWIGNSTYHGQVVQITMGRGYDIQ